MCQHDDQVPWAYPLQEQLPHQPRLVTHSSTCRDNIRLSATFGCTQVLLYIVFCPAYHSPLEDPDYYLALCDEQEGESRMTRCLTGTREADASLLVENYVPAFPKLGMPPRCPILACYLYHSCFFEMPVYTLLPWRVPAKPTGYRSAITKPGWLFLPSCKISF